MSLSCRSAPASDWQVVKRDGRTEAFDPGKITSAVSRCFVNSLRMDPGQAWQEAESVARRVVNVLASQRLSRPGVEDVQRAVIHQLWADGRPEAAEHYTIYREERRRLRESRPLDPEVARLIEEDARHFPTPLQYYQFVSKFSRWREQDRRRETWREANERVFAWFATVPQFSLLSDGEVSWLREMMFGFKASPALRVVQMAGPALERDHVGVFNCAYHPIADLFAFAELLYILMQGTGAGFSVESEYIDELPRVKKQKKGVEPQTYVVPDSTEGWCDALLFGLEKWFAGEDVLFDFSQVRPAGSRLKTKGGQSSGPGPLRDLLAFTRGVVLRRQGKRLTDLDVHDVCCMIGKIVQVGGVRRASCISLSDLDSVAMREAKHGNWWERNGQRSMANNSAVYEDRPSVEAFLEEWLGLVKSRSGERGIFNRDASRRHAPRRRKKARFGVNPCSEIILPPFSFCNLTISIVRGHETREELADKVRAATYFGVLQSCCTNFRYLREDWRRNVEEERLIGVDLMGHLDHPLLRPGAAGREELVGYLKGVVAETVQALAGRFGINYSAANTCLKPGGDSGVLFGTTSLAPYYGRHQVRRTRESVHSPVCKFLKAAGVPWEPAAEDEAGLVAFVWPKKNPDGCITRDDMTAIEQLENWLFWKRHWAEHSCSVTIYVKEHEWPAVGAWVWEHFDELTGVSFLPWDNGSYRTAPNEVLTEEEYEKMAAAFPALDWSKLGRYETEDRTEGSRTYACTSGACDL